MSWPYAGDSPLARARRVAHAYRAALSRADHDACEQLDAQMRSYGQTWVVPAVLIVDENEQISTAQAADLAAVDAATIRQWRRRGIVVGQRVGGRWRYTAGDILAVTLNTRRRGTRARA